TLFLISHVSCEEREGETERVVDRLPLTRVTWFSQVFHVYAGA
ncbi:mCG15979, partial [Mus musculus]